MSEAKVKGYLERLVNLAVDNHDLWDAKVLVPASPASKANSVVRSSMKRLVDGFDANLNAIKRGGNGSFSPMGNNQ